METVVPDRTKCHSQQEHRSYHDINVTFGQLTEGDESTASALKTLAVRLHSTGLSLRETAVAPELFGVTRPHQAIFQWVTRYAEEAPNPSTASPSRVAVDETAIDIGTEQHWLYAAIDIETKLLLGVYVSRRRRTEPAAEFLHQLAEKHDFS